MKHINIYKVESLPLRLTSLILFISLAFLACKDDTEEITIVAQDFIGTVDEYPMANQDLGKIVASTNKGELSYYILTQSPANAISLDESTGEIRVKDVTRFDYQKNQGIEATVRVSNGNISENVNIIIKIENINDVEINDFTTSMYENPEEFQVIGSVSATAEEGNIIYSIVSQSPDNSFSVNPDTGELQVISPSHFSYDDNETITGQIMAKSGEITELAQITIHLLKQLEINDFTTSMYEDPDEFQVIGSVSATSEEGNIIYSIVSQSPENSFSVNPDTGELQVMNPSHFSYDKNQTITGQVMAESMGATDVAEITINLKSNKPVVNENDVFIMNQSQLDEFQEMKYQSFDWNLTIGDDGSGNPISTLEQLSSLTYVGGSLTVVGLDNLKDLKGLENITIVGSLIVRDNINLLNLDAMANLQDALWLIFTDNLSLDSYCGLQPILSKHTYAEPSDAAKLNTIPPLPPKVFIVRDNKSNPKVAEILAMDCD